MRNIPSEEMALFYETALSLLVVNMHIDCYSSTVG